MKALKVTAAALLFLLALQAATALWGKTFWLNLSDSEPIGLYRLEKLQRPVRRGDLVLMEIPAEFHRYVYGRHWLPKGWPLMKHIGALSGDVFCVGASSFFVNGRELGPVFRTDKEGLPLPDLKGCHVIPEGCFLPVALRIERSFDGRYMGPVPLRRIRGRLTAIWTK